jgi:TolB-like protein/Tfp pilus assembly protein PilF
VNEFFARLKQRKLVQWAIAYFAAAFALIQVIDVVADSYDWPHMVMHFVFGVLALGFVVALVLAWYHGERGAQRVSGPELLLIALALAIGGGLLWHFGRAGSSVAPTKAATAARTGTSPHAAAASGPVTSSGSSVTAASMPPASVVASQPIPGKSIAVLPFLDESGNKDQQYFSDGLSEDLITALSQFGGLKVISRDSAFQFRGSKDTSAEIGMKLGVAHLLEGSVQREGDQVRISATLVNAADGSTLWAQHYDRPYKDLFALQDAITKVVAAALQAKLMTAPGAVVQSDRPPSGNLDAYAAFLRGRAEATRVGCGDNSDVPGDFQNAIRIDPRYALAYVALARCWVGTFRGGHTFAEGQRQIAQAQAAIQTALTLDPDLAAARVAHGAVLYNMIFDWYGAESEFRRALQLAPNDPAAKGGLANVLATLGQLRAAIALQRAAVEVNPRGVVGWMSLGSMLVGSGQLNAAEHAFHKCVDMFKSAGFCNWQLAVIEVLRGNAQRAMSLAREVPSQGGWRSLAIAAAAQIGSNRAEADAALQQAIAENANENGNYQIAELYALRRDPDHMFEYLDHAWEQRDSGIGLLLQDPLILRYQHDPRFAAFCKKVGLPTTTDAVAMQ